jgi:hypothetical protein
MSTKQKFWELAENWHQRTHRLRELSQNETETPERKAKALKLFLIMLGRMQSVIQMAIRATTPKVPNNFDRGGI